MNTGSPGVVFDCNVFLQALANDESRAAKALDFVEAARLLCSTRVADFSAQLIRSVKRIAQSLLPACLLADQHVDLLSH